VSPALFGGIANLRDVSGTAYFQASDSDAGGHSATGVELWRSDGTEGETVFVKDIWPGSGWSQPGPVVPVGGTLIFAADDGSLGRELWQTDGSESGTVLLREINPGPGTSNANYFTQAGRVVFFVADDGSTGQELWKTDGTSVGTVMVKDINPGNGGSALSNLTMVAGTLFFTANDGTNGPALWKSDGTSEGTVLLKSISNANELTASGGLLYLTGSGNNGTAGGKLWRSDGTVGGTSVLRSFFATGGGAAVGNLTNRDGVLFFRADDGINGSELWASLGTPSTTVLVQDMNLGPASSSPASVTVSGPRLTLPLGGGHFLTVGPWLFFVADDGIHGSELWVLPRVLLW
jgi:ELWxxDGT repeat protein